MNYNKSKKVSRNDLIRKCNELNDLKRSADKNAITNYKALLVLAAKLYVLSPEDEVFSNGTFHPKALEGIKKQAELNKKEFEARLQAALSNKSDDSKEKDNDSEIIESAPS